MKNPISTRGMILLALSLGVGLTAFTTFPAQAQDTPDVGLTLEETVSLRRVSRAVIGGAG